MAMPKGQTGNPNGRPKGAKNKITLDLKGKLKDGMPDDFVKKIYKEIEEIDNLDARVRNRLKLLEFFIPKPKDAEDVANENEFRRKVMERMFPDKLD